MNYHQNLIVRKRRTEQPCPDPCFILEPNVGAQFRCKPLYSQKFIVQKMPDLLRVSLCVLILGLLIAQL